MYVYFEKPSWVGNKLADTSCGEGRVGPCRSPGSFLFILCSFCRAAMAAQILMELQKKKEKKKSKWKKWKKPSGDKRQQEYLLKILVMWQGDGEVWWVVLSRGENSVYFFKNGREWIWKMKMNVKRIEVVPQPFCEGLGKSFRPTFLDSYEPCIGKGECANFQIQRFSSRIGYYLAL